MLLRSHCIVSRQVVLVIIGLRRRQPPKRGFVIRYVAANPSSGSCTRRTNAPGSLHTLDAPQPPQVWGVEHLVRRKFELQRSLRDAPRHDIHRQRCAPSKEDTQQRQRANP